MRRGTRRVRQVYDLPRSLHLAFVYLYYLYLDGRLDARQDVSLTKRERPLR
jgi:hypothetical protein